MNTQRKMMFSRPVASGSIPSVMSVNELRPPVNRHRPEGRFVDAGQHTQKRRLARSVVADNSDTIAILESQGYCLQGTYEDGLLVLRKLAAELAEYLQLEGAGMGIVDREFDADVGKPDMSQERRLTTNRRRGAGTGRRRAK